MIRPPVLDGGRAARRRDHPSGGSRETGGPKGPPVIGAGKRRGLAAHHPEAIGAVDRTRAGRPERDLRLVAAPRTGRVVHLTRAAREAAPAAVPAPIAIAAGAAAGCPALGAARGATLRSGREALLRKELLLGRGKHEVDSTVATGEHLIGVGHKDPSQQELDHVDSPLARRRPGILPLPRCRPLDWWRGEEGRVWRRSDATSTRGVLPERPRSASHSAQVP